MNVSVVGKKIRKWDEVTGNEVEIQIPETIDPVEDVGMGPSISRNHMRGIEDMVEQNDNSFDGIINNVAVPQESVMEKIREQHEKTKVVEPAVPEKKPPIFNPCREM